MADFAISIMWSTRTSTADRLRLCGTLQFGPLLPQRAIDRLVYLRNVNGIPVPTDDVTGKEKSESLLSACVGYKEISGTIWDRIICPSFASVYFGHDVC
jgi:hypothetical protein